MAGLPNRNWLCSETFQPYWWSVLVLSIVCNRSKTCSLQWKKYMEKHNPISLSLTFESYGSKQFWTILSQIKMAKHSIKTCMHACLCWGQPCLSLGSRCSIWRSHSTAKKSQNKSSPFGLFFNEYLTMKLVFIPPLWRNNYSPRWNHYFY